MRDAQMSLLLHPEAMGALRSTNGAVPAVWTSRPKCRKSVSEG